MWSRFGTGWNADCNRVPTLKASSLILAQQKELPRELSKSFLRTSEQELALGPEPEPELEQLQQQEPEQQLQLEQLELQQLELELQLELPWRLEPELGRSCRLQPCSCS